MNYTMQVQTTTANSNIFVKNFSTEQELQSVMKLCNSVPRIGFLGSLVIPVRTDNLRNFCKDFFLPTFFNGALKIEDIALKILLAPFCILLDICSLGLRVMSVIPRVFYNHFYSKESHAFYQYLIKNGVPPSSLEAGHVYLKEETHTQSCDGLSTAFEGETFNFMQLPLHESRSSSGSGTGSSSNGVTASSFVTITR